MSNGSAEVLCIVVTVRPDSSQEELRPAKTWEMEHAAAIGRAIKKQRGRWPAIWLERRTEQLGLKMTRQAIADLESGRRRFVTTGELLVLASALNTSPIALIYPDPSDKPDNLVEVLPGTEVTGFKAAQWFSGHHKDISEAAIEPDPEEDGDAAESARRRAALNSELLNGWRQLDELHQRRARVTAQDGGKLTAEELELLDFYNTEIESLRRLLKMLDYKSTGVENHA
jgi:hypothetical protein